jgi:hypothetical protein
VAFVRRRLAAVLLLALALPALAAAATTDPQKKFTAADKAKAASIVLKRSDFVAGWARKAVKPSEDESDIECPSYRPNQSDLVLTGEAMFEFAPKAGLPSIFSVANVYRTRRDAALAWARSDKPALVPCAASMFERELEADGSTATVTRKGKISFPRYAPRTSAYRFSLDVTVTSGTGEKQTVPFTIHMVALGHGRGDHLMMTIGVGGGVPMSDLKAFARRTAQRLAAAKL